MASYTLHSNRGCLEAALLPRESMAYTVRDQGLPDVEIPQHVPARFRRNAPIAPIALIGGEARS